MKSSHLVRVDARERVFKTPKEGKTVGASVYYVQQQGAVVAALDEFSRANSVVSALIQQQRKATNKTKNIKRMKNGALPTPAPQSEVKNASEVVVQHSRRSGSSNEKEAAVGKHTPLGFRV